VERPSTIGRIVKILKVIVDGDQHLVSRWPLAAASQGDQDRNVKAIASRLSSTNTIVLQ
jgi:hypothetical protein